MNPAFRNWKTFLVVAYSLVVMATVLPGFDRIPNTIVIPYFLVVPGYCFTVLLREGERITDLAFYSLVWSLAIVGGVFSVETLFRELQALSLSAVVPPISIATIAFDHYHRK